MIKITTNSSEIMQTRRESSEILKMLREKIHQWRILDSAKLSFKSGGEIKTFSGKEKFKEFVASISALQEMLK